MARKTKELTKLELHESEMLVEKSTQFYMIIATHVSQRQLLESGKYTK